MIGLSLASNLIEARKFFCDDEMRSGTPVPDVMRVKTPFLSRAWGPISIAVANRSDDVAWDHHRSRDIKRHCDEGDRCSESEDAARISEPELMLAPQNANTPNPHLIEFVRLLARRAAREWYEKITEECRPERS
jgi:hypothetical protein